MTDELAKVYDPKDHEERLYQWWEGQGYFHPERQVELGLASEDGPRWCITMPPPNVTGVLHLGHAMTAAVEDLMTRYYRARTMLALPLRTWWSANCAKRGLPVATSAGRSLSSVAGSGRANRSGALPSSTRGWVSHVIGHGTASRLTRIWATPCVLRLCTSTRKGSSTGAPTWSTGAPAAPAPSPTWR
jgi:hypothetical protein